VEAGGLAQIGRLVERVTSALSWVCCPPNYNISWARLVLEDINPAIPGQN